MTIKNESNALEPLYQTTTSLFSLVYLSNLFVYTLNIGLQSVHTILKLYYMNDVSDLLTL